MITGQEWLEQTFLLALRQITDCIKNQERDDDSYELPTQYTARDGAIYWTDQPNPVGRIHPALLHATDTLLEQTGARTPSGAILSDLREYLTTGKSRTPSQIRLFNRRGLARFRFMRTIVRPRDLERAAIDRTLHLLQDANSHVKLDQYGQFREKFGLADEEATLVGWQQLTAITVRDAMLSVWLTNIFEDEGFKTLIEPCLLTREELYDLRNFGDRPLTELQAKVKEVSGLSLTWK